MISPNYRRKEERKYSQMTTFDYEKRESVQQQSVYRQKSNKKDNTSYYKKEKEESTIEVLTQLNESNYESHILINQLSRRSTP